MKPFKEPFLTCGGRIGEPVMLPAGQVHPDDAELKAEKQDDHFLIVSATGTGKTRILGALMDGSKVPTLILTPRKLLGSQALEEFCRKMDIPRNLVGVIDGDVKGKRRIEALQKLYIITTYQSLPSFVEKSHETGHYEFKPLIGHRPLILLDEAHTAQGPRTSAILNDLKLSSIIGGITATDAGVSRTLFGGQTPIFHLDLPTAIDQGLLSNGIRTGVIDVKIDEDWVKNLVKTQRGKEFNQEDTEKFARTPAVIKAMAEFHLNYADAELGKLDRFPTLVFTQGVNAARQGADTFNQMAVQAHSEARAGFISGDMEDGEQSRILDNFKAGKINVLFNDRMLEMGYDLPEATVTYSLKPTQYRHTAEQQLGRVTRRQPEGYAEKYGTDKVAFAVNVRPQGVRPFLFGEVVGGRPAIYAAGKEPVASPGGKQSGGEKINPLAHRDDIRIHTNFEDLAAIIKETEKSREIIKYPPKTDEWLSKSDVFRELKTNPHTQSGLPDIWEDIQLQFEKAGEVVIDGRAIDCHLKQAGSLAVLCIARKELSWLEERMDRPEIRGEGWLGKTEFAKRVGTTSSNSKFAEICGSIELSQKHKDKPNLVIDGHEIQAGYIRNETGQRVLAFHESEVSWFKEKLNRIDKTNLPVKTAEWKTSSEFEKSLGVQANPEFQRLWNEIKQLSNPSENKPVLFENHSFQCGYVISPPRTPFCMHESELGWFTKRLGIAPPKTDEWKSKEQFARGILKTDPRGEGFDNLWKSIEDVYKKDSGNVLVDGHQVQCGYFRAKPKTPFCINEGEADWFKRQINIAERKTPGWHTSQQFSTLLGMSSQKGPFKALWQK